MRQLERVAVLRRLIQNVALGADVAGERHHQLLADRIDRWVRHLREELLEIVEQRLGLVREASQRRVRTHRTHRLLALGGDRQQDRLQVFIGIAERPLPPQQRVLVGGIDARRFRQVVQMDLVFLKPLRVRPPRRQALFQFLVRDDAAFGQVGEEHLARLQTPFELHFLRLHRQHAGFRRHDQQAVVRHQVARRTKAVAIERRADHPAVRESHRRRAVPRLHQRRVIFIKRALLGRHGGVGVPRFRNQHRHDVRKRAPGHEQEFHRIVETRRVAAARLDDREELLDVVAEKRGREHVLAREHPVHVALQRVDLAVVAEVAERVRELPGGEGVGREALVHQAQRAHRVVIRELVVEVRDLRRQQQPFVDDDAR